MSTDNKDVVYLDVDDEITSIIDKVRGSKKQIVALVLPKRATMLQSSVNMKLLKRASDQGKKQLVLITAEASLLPLAGSVGLYTARNLQSKPEIPVAASVASAPAMDELLTINEAKPTDFSPEEAANKPVGDLAAGAASETPAITGRYAEPDETMELDNTEDLTGENTAKYSLTPATAAEAADQTKKPKPPKNKKLKVPNFLKFRRRLVVGLLILLIIIGGIIAAAIILPHATITLATNSSDINSNVQANLDPQAKTLNLAQSEVPAQLAQTQKTNSQQVATTGQKNEGQTASGSITMMATKCQGNPFMTPSDVPAGTGVSASGMTFITRQATSFHGTGTDGNGCFTYSSNSDTPVTAQQPGSKYNVDNANFTVNGRSDVSASGSTSGGSDKIVQIVTQTDISNAKKQLSAQNSSAIKSSLASQLRGNSLKPLAATFKSSPAKVTASAKPGDQADNVTVTATVTYYMYGYNQNALKKLINKNVNGQIDTNKQSILDDGLAKANFSLQSETTASAQVQVQTTALVGPHLSAAKLKKQAAGKKSGAIKNLLGANPGIKNVQVKYGPFWVSSVPKNTSKITIKFIKAGSK
ncbi:MAG: hypothetical protein ACREGA_03520 [Candidatus Saccharimonadales bacterium]